MPWKRLALAFAILALAAGVSGASQGAQAPAAKPAAAKTKPIGHSPRPAEDVAEVDLFHGYRCSDDCLLHQQGYQWASEHKIRSPRDCRGTSEEFIEGCLAFAGVDGPLGHREFDPSFPHMVGVD